MPHESPIRYVVASDVSTRDGVGLETYLADDLVMEIFRDDSERRIYVTLFADSVDLAVIESSIATFKEYPGVNTPTVLPRLGGSAVECPLLAESGRSIGRARPGGANVRFLPEADIAISASSRRSLCLLTGRPRRFRPAARSRTGQCARLLNRVVSDR